jgi:hypothetical protein
MRARSVAGEVEVVEVLVVAVVARVLGGEELLRPLEISTDAQVRGIDGVPELGGADGFRGQVLRQAQDVGVVRDVLRREDLDVVVEERVGRSCHDKARAQESSYW